MELYRNGQYCYVSIVEIMARVFLGPRPLGMFATRVDRSKPLTIDNLQYTGTWASSRGVDKKGERVPFAEPENAVVDAISSVLAENTARELINLLTRAMRRG